MRIAQHQRDIAPHKEHPATILIAAKKEYPSVEKWDVLDAESLGQCGFERGFMRSPYDTPTNEERMKKEYEKQRQAAIERASGSMASVDREYAKKFAQMKKSGRGGQHGVSEYIGTC